MKCKVLIIAAIIYGISILVHLRAIYGHKTCTTLCNARESQWWVKMHTYGIAIDLAILGLVYYFCKRGNEGVAIGIAVAPIVVPLLVS
jgi:hypothetical protein